MQYENLGKGAVSSDLSKIRDYLRQHGFGVDN